MDDCIENRDCEDWDLVPEPRSPLYQKLYYRLADWVWYYRIQLGRLLAGNHFGCND